MRLSRAWSVFVAGAVLAGCHGTTAHATRPHAVLLEGTLKTTGAYQVDADFQIRVIPAGMGAGACARFAERGTLAGGVLGFGTPIIQRAGSPIGAIFVLRVASYHGPGTYAASATAQAGVRIVEHFKGTRFGWVPGTPSALTTAANGAGHVELPNLRAQDGRQLSAQFSWRCQPAPAQAIW